jgi:hypothetical protein
MQRVGLDDFVSIGFCEDVWRWAHIMGIARKETAHPSNAGTFSLLVSGCYGRCANAKGPVGNRPFVLWGVVMLEFRVEVKWFFPRSLHGGGVQF